MWLILKWFIKSTINHERELNPDFEMEWNANTQSTISLNKNQCIFCSCKWLLYSISVIFLNWILLDLKKQGLYLCYIVFICYIYCLSFVSLLCLLVLNKFKNVLLILFVGPTSYYCSVTCKIVLKMNMIKNCDKIVDRTSSFFPKKKNYDIFANCQILGENSGK